MEPAEERRPRGFQKGHPRYGGRKKGVLPAMPTLLKECVLMAATNHGKDGKGKEELVGFLLHVIKEDLAAFCTLLGKVMPLQFQARADLNVNAPYETLEDVKRDMAAKGLTRERMLLLAHILDEEPDNALVWSDNDADENARARNYISGRQWRSNTSIIARWQAA